MSKRNDNWRPARVKLMEIGFHVQFETKHRLRNRSYGVALDLVFNDKYTNELVKAQRLHLEGIQASLPSLNNSDSGLGYVPAIISLVGEDWVSLTFGYGDKTSVVMANIASKNGRNIKRILRSTR